ncbi:MAG: cytochrome c biogenesis CcdA family protein [DPANN group archaeon]|nr:cytochrome c biogenesis CcdA family protein [DPANN group archaeon]
MDEKYKNEIIIHRQEIYHDNENYKLFEKTKEKFDLKNAGIPLIVIGNTYLMGDKSIIKELENEIIRCETKDCECQLSCDDTLPEDISPAQIKPKSITLPVIIISGLIDGINPCAFAVIIILLTYLKGIGNKKKMFVVGMTYIFAVYVTYFVAGLGLLSTFQFAGITRSIFDISAILVIIFGLINLKDFFWYGKGISLEIPKQYKGTIHKYILKATIPAALILGVLVSMFELPCTGGVYLAILGLLSNSMTQLSAIPYLLLYNFAFILPLIIIMIVMYKGYDPKKIEDARKKERKWMRLMMGLLMVALGVAMLTGLI